MLKARFFDSEVEALDMRRLGLENGVQRRVRHLPARDEGRVADRFLLRAVQTLAHALEAKDAYTWGHSSRVSIYAVAIARELGLSEAEVATVALGGELHDVGKIGVREELLRKPGPLTPDEYRHVMQHTIIGDRILNPLLHNRPAVLGIVRWHHEHVDGSSLPDGLRGEEIPPAARIVAVADAFDAMTSERPYRAALTKRDSLNELEAKAGSQFDVDCVRAARRVFSCSDLRR